MYILSAWIREIIAASSFLYGETTTVWVYSLEGGRVIGPALLLSGPVLGILLFTLTGVILEKVKKRLIFKISEYLLPYYEDTRASVCSCSVFSGNKYYNPPNWNQ